MNDAATRPAEAGERCTCGRPATQVFITEQWGETGYCGLPDGGQKGPCLWCGAEEHIGRCPEYRLRATDKEAES